MRLWLSAVACVVISLSASSSARSQVWLGPSVGFEPAIRSSDAQDGLGYGFDLAIRAFHKSSIDLLISGYTSGVVSGNDADPWVPVAVGVRWSRTLGESQETFVPFASVGVAGGLTIGSARAVVGYIQPEVGLEVAPRSAVGVELGVRARVGYPIVESSQAFLLLRFGRSMR